MTKHRILWWLVGFLMVVWTYSMILLLAEKVVWQLFFAIGIPLSIIVIVLRQHYVTVPKKNIDTLAKLADDIDAHQTDDAEHFDEQKVPLELSPVVQALNRLLDFYQGRYRNERDFTANASHELRTPLAGIRLQTEIAMRVEDPKQRQQAFNNIIKAVDRGTRLVEQLLVLSRLTFDRVEFGLEPFEVGHLVQRNIEELQDVANRKFIEVRRKHDKQIYITANKESISILINNLIRNAINYSPQESYIEVDIKENNDEISLLVSDMGPGIPEHERKRVMERFQKASAGSKIGTGLGLAIVKRIIDLHYGNIELTSTERGRGLTVTVSLPKQHE